MKLYVDPNKCDSSGDCVRNYPELFRFREGSKKAEAIVDEIPPRYRNRFSEIADVCPVKAIQLIQ